MSTLMGTRDDWNGKPAEGGTNYRARQNCTRRAESDHYWNEALAEIDALHPERWTMPKIDWRRTREPQRRAWFGRLGQWVQEHYARYEKLKALMSPVSQEVWAILETRALAFSDYCELEHPRVKDHSTHKSDFKTSLALQGWLWFLSPKHPNAYSERQAGYIIGWKRIGAIKLNLDDSFTALGYALKACQKADQQEAVKCIQEAMALIKCELTGGDDCPFENDEEQNEDLRRAS